MNIDISAELKNAAKPLAWKPEIFDLSVSQDRETVSELFAKGEIKVVSDDYEEQLREHFAYLNPQKVFAPGFADIFRQWFEEQGKKSPLWQQGRWVYYPWRAAIVHVLEDKAFQQLRTSRNRYLISDEEQARFANAVVGIVGSSIGNNVALSIVLQGGANHIRLADFDQLALSNINRVRSSVIEFGRNKVEMTARQIYELNPYAEVELFTDGLTEENIERFFSGPPRLDVIIDELDNIAIKYLIREYAQRLKMPVVMGTDNGDNAVIDIERHDLDSNVPFFHGRMGDVSYESLKGLDKRSIGMLATKFIGADAITPKARDSMMEMGKSIVSWPQLGGAALLNGCAVAYCVRAIVNGQPIENDRALVSLDEKLIPGYNSPEAQAQRQHEAQAFAKILGLMIPNAHDRLAASIGIPMESRYFEADAGRMHCKVAGSGPPLLLIHGLNIGWGQWYAVLPKLAESHTVYAIDLPGAGDSAKVDFLSSDSPKLSLDAIDRALRHFCPQGAMVVGHSLGGWAALKLAASGHPSVKAVGAIDAMGFSDFVPWRFRPLAWRPAAKFIASKAVPPTRANIEDFLGSVTVRRDTMTPEYVDYVVEHVNRPTVSHPFLLIHSLFQPNRLRIRRDLILSPDELASIRCPAVVAHGADDPLIPLGTVERSMRKIPNVEVMIFNEVGHALPVENPAGFALVIEKMVSLSKR